MPLAEGCFRRNGYSLSMTMNEGWLGSCEIDDGCNNGRDDNPEQLKPIKERDADELWTSEVVERRPEQDDEGNDKE